MSMNLLSNERLFCFLKEKADAVLRVYLILSLGKIKEVDSLSSCCGRVREVKVHLG